MENGELQLKENHAYAFQIQGQLNITKRSVCYFVVWSPKQVIVTKIFRDKELWERKMLPKLKMFYFEALLPELIDSRVVRKLEIRDTFIS